MAPLGWGSQGQGLVRLVITYLSLFQKHVGAQEKISPVSQTLPYLSLLSWAHPPQPGMNQAGKAVLGPHQRICVQGFSISGDYSLQRGRGEGEATLARGNAEVLTGPWSCPHPIHGCEPEADNGSDCGPGDSAGSWHLFSGSSACSGPAKDRERVDRQRWLD